MKSRNLASVCSTLAVVLVLLCSRAVFAQGLPGSVPGVFGNALSFNGNSYVEIADSRAYKTESFTIEAWVRVDRLEGKQTIARKPGEMEIYIDGQGSLCLDIRYLIPAGYPVDRTLCHRTERVVAGTRHHIAVTFIGIGMSQER